MENETLAAIQGLKGQMEEVLKRQESSLNKDQVERICEAIVEKAHPVKSTMIVGADSGEMTQEQLLEKFEAFKRNNPNAYSKPKIWATEYGKQFGDMRGFLKAVRDRNHAKLKYFEPDASKASSDAQTEGTGSTGGYLVPTDFEYEVIKLLYYATFIRQVSRIIPMGTLKRTLPSQLTNVAVSWAGEAAARSVTKATFGQFTQTAKVMALVIKSTDEFLRDSAVNIQLFLAELVAGAAAREEERVALVGNTGASDPFNGVYYASGVLTNSLAGANVTYDDIINLRFALSAAYDQDAVFVVNRNILKKVMKLKDANGQYIWASPKGDGNVPGGPVIPGQLADRPYYISDQLPTNLGAGNALSPMIYGKFNQFLWISDRAGLALLQSQEASDWVSGALDSAFMSGQTWLRFTKALSIDVVVGNAFATMLC